MERAGAFRLLNRAQNPAGLQPAEGAEAFRPLESGVRSSRPLGPEARNPLHLAGEASALNRAAGPVSSAAKLSGVSTSARLSFSGYRPHTRESTHTAPPR